MRIKIKLKVLLSALFGIFLVGMGVAWNNCAALGNDSIGIVYDGVRSIANLNSDQLGMASNLVNLGLILLLLFVGKRYVNIGTLIYILPYGFFLDIGARLYRYLIVTESLKTSIIMGAAGCLLLYTGVAVFITVDIGLDPFTGVVMVIKDKLGWEYRYTKITFDLSMIILGTLLGGKLGVVTILTAFTAGPMIQFISNILKMIFDKNKKRGVDEQCQKEVLMK